MAKTPKHPLDGKVMVFKYHEEDWNDGGDALAYFRLRKGKLETIFNPQAFLEPDELNFNIQDEKTSEFVSVEELGIRRIKRLEIKEVVSVFMYKKRKFFGIVYGPKDLSDKTNEEGEIECWEEWGPVYSGTDEYELLTERSIKVKFWDEDAGKFLE